MSPGQLYLAHILKSTPVQVDVNLSSFFLLSFIPSPFILSDLFTLSFFSPNYPTHSPVIYLLFPPPNALLPFCSPFSCSFHSLFPTSFLFSSSVFLLYLLLVTLRSSESHMQEKNLSCRDMMISRQHMTLPPRLWICILKESA